MARCYILASMSFVLQYHLKDYLTTKDMFLSRKEMFREQEWPDRQIVMRTLTNTMMAEETPVRDHVLKKIDH